jgi:hypothetical protein
MDQKYIRNVAAKVYRQFPEMSGIQPKVRRKTDSQGSPAGFLLTFNTKVNVGGKALSRWVRVVTDDYGKIIKITTSH